MIRWEPNPHGRRCYLSTPVGRARVHHGLLGIAFLIVGAGLVAHDWADRLWLHD